MPIIPKARYETIALQKIYIDNPKKRLIKIHF